MKHAAKLLARTEAEQGDWRTIYRRRHGGVFVLCSDRPGGWGEAWTPKTAAIGADNGPLGVGTELLSALPRGAPGEAES